MLGVKLLSSPQLEIGDLKLLLGPPKGGLQVSRTAWWQKMSAHNYVLNSKNRAENSLTPPPFPTPISFRDQKKLLHKMLSNKVNQSPAESTCELRTLVVLCGRGVFFLPGSQFCLHPLWELTPVFKPAGLFSLPLT